MLFVHLWAIYLFGVQTVLFDERKLSLTDAQSIPPVES